MDTSIWTPQYGHLNMDTHNMDTHNMDTLNMDTSIWTPQYGHLNMDTHNMDTSIKRAIIMEYHDLLAPEMRAPL